MECFLLFALLVAIAICITSNIACLLKVFTIEKSTHKMLTEYHEIFNSLSENFEQIENKIDNISNKMDIELDHFEDELTRVSIRIENIDRSLQASREAIDSATPMKSNNWDSMKKAFKTSPIKVEINERN